MEVKAGYKQTEVGVIPEDWEIKPLGAVLTRGRLGGNYPNQDVETDHPLMKMGNLGRGSFNLAKVEFISSSINPMNEHRLHFGDVLFNTRNTLDLVGKVAIWHDQLPLAYYNSNLMRLEFDRAQLYPNDFANYALNSTRVIGELRVLATGTTSVAAIYTRDLMGLKLALPPLSEQQAIANALRDVDELIASLEALITKKRDLKQAAMQQLLTGKTRLAGFSGEWESQSLGQLADIKTGSRNNEDKVPSGQYAFFVRSATVERINRYSYDCEAILVPGEGNIGSIFHYIDGKFDAHQRVYVINNFVDAVSGRYIFYVMRQFFGAWAMQNTVKATVDSLRLPTFQTFSMYIPSDKAEQEAIVTVISDIDAELAELEARRDKNIALKQGMMQELLTGRTRLV
jgi:type I restriction enzyme S subunit